MIQELGENLIPMVAIGGGFFVAICWILLATIESLVRNWMNTRLKMKLLEKGYSANEIARVVNAGNSEAEDEVVTSVQRPAPPVKSGAAF